MDRLMLWPDYIKLSQALFRGLNGKRKFPADRLDEVAIFGLQAVDIKVCISILPWEITAERCLSNHSGLDFTFSLYVRPSSYNLNVVTIPMPWAMLFTTVLRHVMSQFAHLHQMMTVKKFESGFLLNVIYILDNSMNDI